VDFVRQGDAARRVQRANGSAVDRRFVQCPVGPPKGGPYVSLFFSASRYVAAVSGCPGPATSDSLSRPSLASSPSVREGPGRSRLISAIVSRKSSGAAVRARTAILA